MIKIGDNSCIIIHNTPTFSYFGDLSRLGAFLSVFTQSRTLTFQPKTRMLSRAFALARARARRFAKCKMIQIQVYDTPDTPDTHADTWGYISLNTF